MRKMFLLAATGLLLGAGVAGAHAQNVIDRDVATQMQIARSHPSLGIPQLGANVSGGEAGFGGLNAYYAEPHEYHPLPPVNSGSAIYRGR